MGETRGLSILLNRGSRFRLVGGGLRFPLVVDRLRFGALRIEVGIQQFEPSI
jgi:hypothetical protein